MQGINSTAAIMLYRPTLALGENRASVINEIHITQIREIVTAIRRFVIKAWYLKGWNMARYLSIVIRIIVIADRPVKMKLVEVYTTKAMQEKSCWGVVSLLP